MTDGIRPYGPGKFSTMVDEYVYQVSLDGGCEEECGTTDSGSWYGIMRNGSTIFRDHDPLLETLTPEEAELIKSCAGVIIEEDSQGFVSVTYYENRDDMEAMWSQLEDATSEEDNEEDNEDEEE